MTTLFLTGDLGTTKAVIGKELSLALSLTLLDTDELIEKVLNKTMTDIVIEEGEEAFLDYEEKLLDKIGGQPILLSTGSGIYKRQRNRLLMKQKGVFIYLRSHSFTNWSSLNVKTTSPLSSKTFNEKQAQLLPSPLPIDLVADYVIHTAGKSVDTIVEEIVSCLSKDHRFWAY